VKKNLIIIHKKLHTSCNVFVSCACVSLSVFDRPWRTIEWGTGKTANLLYLKTYKPQAEGRQLRILLHGPVGAGKSSFINSVSSALKGRICTLALVDNTSHDSFTTTYLTYNIQKDKPGTFYPFVFNDIRGLDPQKGVLVDDIELALMGHVKEGYMFNPGCKLSEGNEFYNKSPTDNDKVHVLVCVVPAHTLSSMNDKTVWEIRDVRMKASRLGESRDQIVAFFL
uniref:G domain-containing protein n=1 Tax=Lates calcarifer TaxID=8187 RepID=A0A4W6DYH0_LATCA